MSGSWAYSHATHCRNTSEQRGAIVNKSIPMIAGMTVFAACAGLWAAPAMAGHVSIGVNIGVPGAYVAPPPVYVQPAPIYAPPPPPPPPPVYVRPAPVYYVNPAPVYVERDYYYRGHHRHWHRPPPPPPGYYWGR
ncbi:hypothetical protein RB24_03710 [Herbaspirillum rubrisubalbicans]|uniref:Transmembrane protein n=1 Tax=Herbaspirillum rubrisubalbicans TaxID=80842 RepID=A0ABX9C668_9BURK|nr:hypothetical protein RB24_03710 [Herbaspirillum rubrisubalbicans]